MYLPPSQYRKVRNNQNYKTAEGVFVNTPVIETSTGEYFTLSEKNLKEENFDEIICVFPEQLQNTSQKENIGNTYYPIPTPEDYVNGFFYRYFVRDKRGGSVREVRKEYYINNTGTTYLQFIQLKWFLSEPIEDQKIKDHLILGSTSKNKKEIERGEQIIPGLSFYLKNPEQFLK